MRRCIDQSNGVASSSPSPSWLDCIINTGGYDFRKGHPSRSRLERERPIPITEFLDGYNPDPETKRVMGIAFEMTRAALRLVDRDDLSVAIIAKTIIELAKAGERNPDLLCERALKDLREPPP
jgi:hypothetical protein